MYILYLVTPKYTIVDHDIIRSMLIPMLKIPNGIDRIN